MCAPSALLLLSSFLLLRHVLPLFSVGYGALLGRSFRKLLPMLDQHISSLAARIVAGIGMTRHQTDVGWHCADKKLRRPVSEAAVLCEEIECNRQDVSLQPNSFM